MKATDYIILTACAIVVFSPFLFPASLDHLKFYTAEHGYVLSFIKFALLATFGECLALRIVKGHYWHPGFGLIAKALMWGLLGILIKICFTIFAAGSPLLLASLGFTINNDPPFSERLLLAFTTSVMLNSIFAPVLMILHKILDDHINIHHGKLATFTTMVDVRARIEAIDWSIMWDLVLKKTIPLFWIPAQTITFMLPQDLRILFAAFLGAVLGVILALAGLWSNRT